QPYVALAIGIALTAAIWPVLPRRDSVTDREIVTTLVMIELLVAWIWLNLHHYGQMITVYRDPAVYALRGWWLTTHSSPLVDVSSAAHAASGVPGALTSAAAFSVDGTHAYPQGASLSPGLFAIAGRIGGLRVMLASNLLIGAVALLIFYALTRRIIGSVWGMVPVVIIALSMPMVYFSRETYTEPTAMAADLGGLLLLLVACGKAGESRIRRWALFGAAGATLGISAMARIDGWLAVTGAVVGLGLAAIFAPSSERRSRLRMGVVAFAVGAAVTSGLAWYDLAVNSKFYFRDLFSDARKIVLLSIAATVVVLLVTLVPFGSTRRLIDRFARPVSVAGFWVTLLVCAVLASRPLWLTARAPAAPVSIAAMTGRQKALGLPIDPTRTYAELSANWFGWYLGWPAAIAAAFGLAVLVYTALRRFDPKLLIVGACLIISALLYIYNPNITPDQIWAARRFVPAIFPAAALFAGYAVYWVARSRRWRILAVPLAVGLMVATTFHWGPLFGAREFDGELAQVDSICSAVQRVGGPEPHVIVTAGAGGTGSWGPTLGIVCHASVVSVLQPTAAELAQIQRQWGDPPVAVFSYDPT
ncbi:MAG: hypothetical protein J0H43_15225, partial [Actinobacteria bacterium]|nr:hypothetical protein [Actinomycetota bacterium]